MTPALPKRLAGTTPAVQWSALIALSVALSALLAAIGLPAALLLGPMLAGIAASTNVNVPVVMAMQMIRFIVVLFAAPPLARCLMRYAPLDYTDAPNNHRHPR